MIKKKIFKKDFKLFSDSFFLYQGAYPAFTHKGKTVVFAYGDFVVLDKDEVLKLPKPKVGLKEYDSKEPIITFITTKKCSMRCIYCSVRAGETSDDLTFAMAKTVIDGVIRKSKEIKKLHIIFFGGEPTLSLGLIKEIIDYLAGKKIQADYSLSTNGVLSPYTLDFLQKHRFVINLSFDGLPQIQNFLRPLAGGAQSYGVVENTLKEFVKRKITFKVRATIVEKSVPLMMLFLRRLFKLRVKHVHFEPLNICGRASDIQNILRMPDIRGYIKEYKKCIDYAGEHDMEIVNGIYDNLFSPSQDYCSTATGQKIVVTPMGLVTRCYEVQEEKDEEENCFIVGKVASDKGLKLNENKVKKLEKIMEKNREYCKDCFAKYICSGGCTIRTYRHIQNPEFDLEYRCTLAKELIADAIFRLWQQEQGTK